MYTHPNTWLRCVAPDFGALMMGMRAVVTAPPWRINAVVFGVLAAIHLDPLDPARRTFFELSYRMTFVLAVPPEDSYFTLATPLWSDIFAEIDAGRVPDLDACLYFRFPDSQGGAWPDRWPDIPAADPTNALP